MSLSGKIINYKGEKVISLSTPRYNALIAPTIGSNVIRLYDTINDIEVLRYDPDLTIEELKESSCVYGLPTLYLPNRLDKGILKTSDATYQLPVNEVDLNNHIHGFLHNREYSIVSVEETDTSVIAKTEYLFDETDEAFSYLPISFKAEFTFTLSEEGLFYEFTMTNLSKVQMPYGICNHTAMKGPFSKTAKPEDMRLYIPIGDKVLLNHRCLPTGDIKLHDDYDKQYLSGSMVPVKWSIDNDMYYGEMGDLDGRPFYGSITTDLASGKRVCYEVDTTFKFWIIWNEWGTKDYFCPEPMSWIIDAPNMNLPASESGYLELAPGQSKKVKEHLFTLA